MEEVWILGIVAIVVGGGVGLLWSRRVPSISKRAKLDALKHGTLVKVTGRIGSQTKPLKEQSVGQALQQFRGRAGWAQVRQRRVPFAIELEDGVVHIENVSYLISAQEPSFSSYSKSSVTDSDGNEKSELEIQNSNGLLSAQWNSETGLGTLRRVSLQFGDKVTVLAKVVSTASGITLDATSVTSPKQWEWLEKVKAVPVTTLEEMAALPGKTAVQFYARVAASNPKLAESFVVVNEQEFRGGSDDWQTIRSEGQPLVVEMPGGSVRLLNGDFEHRSSTVLQGQMSFNVDSTETEAGTHHRLTFTHNGQVETAEFDPATKRGTRRYRGIEAGDLIAIIGVAEPGPGGVGVTVYVVESYREAVGILATKSSTPAENDRLDDL